MSCLSRDRLREAVEESASPESAAHLAVCPRCRREVETLRRTLEELRAVDVPEPSPLFWDHLSARVREAIAEEPPRDAASGRWAWLRSSQGRGWLRPALALATTVLIVALFVDRGVRRAPGGPPSPTLPARTAADAMATSGIDLAADDDWQFIVDVAANVADAEAAVADVSDRPDAAADGEGAFDTRTGAFDLAVSELSAEEQRELVKLLNEALAAGAADVPRPGKGDV
jgi:hypothetical protein